MQTKLHIMDNVCMSLSLSESKDEDNNYKKQKSPWQAHPSPSQEEKMQ